MDLRKTIKDRRHAHLLQKANRGDKGSFQTLFREMHPLVFDYLDRRLSDIHDTEDLVSTVFHKFIKNMETFDPRRGGVTAWLMTMARHALIDHLRRTRDTVDLDTMAEILAGPACDPLSGMIRTEEAEQVRIQLTTYPAETREIIALRYGEGMACRDIAQAMGLSEDAVKQRL